jgi:hypothetical protein
MTKLKWWVGVLAMIIGGELERGCLAWWLSEYPDTSKR